MRKTGAKAGAEFALMRSNSRLELPSDPCFTPGKAAQVHQN